MSTTNTEKTLNTMAHDIPAALIITKEAALKSWELIEEERNSVWFKLILVIYSNQLRDPKRCHLAFDWCQWLLQDADIKLKVSILGGGCHGFRYNFAFTTQVQSDDTVIHAPVYKKMALRNELQDSQVDWIVDIISLQYLRGAEIDYQSDLQGERFIIRNLKAKTTCGCGSSFGI